MTCNEKQAPQENFELSRDLSYVYSLGFGLKGYDLSLMAGIRASRLGFGSTGHRSFGDAVQKREDDDE